MIAYIEGRVLDSSENSCVLVTSGGVGYEIFLPTHVLGALPEQGGAAHFFVHTQVREDALELFGFADRDERDTFRTLISINRVGARTALAVLGIFRPDDLRALVLDDDVFGLTRVPGIGKKTAQQIFLELKFKLKLDGLPVVRGKSGAVLAGGGVVRDAVAALSNLGYAEEEAARVVKEALAEAPDMELGEILRASLKLLGKNNR